MPSWTDEYEPVDTRIHRFYEQHPTGRILTELLHHDERQFIVRASVFREPNDQMPCGTGMAQEVIGSSNVNKTSALENAETSAIGRALANIGLSPKGARPSAEEMHKASLATDDDRRKIATLAKQAGLDHERAKGILRDVAGVESTAELPSVKVEDVVKQIVKEFDATPA